ncbi:hypothetical protein GCM10009850_081620 [Nonomuraea monospora]|uniref:Uncharacterized protein n=1 Tax=Nonomuraea monospora TaxID=568818 RepID=A0ABN3CTH2_9ACTN
MVRFADSGHRGLPEETVVLIDQAIREVLADVPDISALPCLADGAGQIFAPALLDLGGALGSSSRPCSTGRVAERVPCPVRRVTGPDRPGFVESISESHMAASAHA